MANSFQFYLNELKGILSDSISTILNFFTSIWGIITLISIIIIIIACILKKIYRYEFLNNFISSILYGIPAIIVLILFLAHRLISFFVIKYIAVICIALIALGMLIDCIMSIIALWINKNKL